MVTPMVQQVKSVVLLLFLAAYVLGAFISLSFLAEGMALLIVVVFFISLPDIKQINRNLVLVLLFISGCLIASTPGPFAWVSAIIENAGIAALLMAVPLLRIVLHYAPYESAIQSVAGSYIATGYHFYLLAIGLTAFLGSVMSIAALPFVYQLLLPIAKKYPQEILDRALARGFVINLFWSPNLVAVAVALRYVPVSWQELAAAGIGFSLLSLALVMLVGKYEIEGLQLPDGVVQEQVVNSAELLAENRRHLWILSAQVLCILIVVASITYFLKTNIYVTVTLVALTVPFLIALVLQAVPIWYKQLDHYRMAVLPGMVGELIIFLTIGFFGYALAHSSLISILQTELAYFITFSPAALSLLIIVATGVLALIGIHPMITISSVAIILGNDGTGLSQPQLAVTFITGYIMYLLLSPFASVVMIISALTEQSVYQAGLKRNWLYALLLAGLVTVIMALWS